MIKRFVRGFVYVVLTLVMVVFTSSNSSHKFYVSLSQIDVNHTRNTLEISTRVFAHDLEDAVYKQSHQKLLLGSPRQDSMATQKLTKYLKDNLIVKQSAEILPLKFVGFEIEADVIWLYTETGYMPSIDEVTIRNSLIIGLYEDQKNIINFRNNGQTKSQICTKTHPEYSFKL